MKNEELSQYLADVQMRALAQAVLDAKVCFNNAVDQAKRVEGLKVCTQLLAYPPGEIGVTVTLDYTRKGEKSDGRQSTLSHP